MTLKLTKMSSQSLVGRFADESAAPERLLKAGDPRGSNRHIDKMVDAYRELRSRGAEAQRLLLILLDHKNPRVRSDAAAYALEFALAEPVLSAMEELPGNVGASVYMILDDWRSGTFDLSYLDKPSKKRRT
jgi:hypothetical protein